MRLRLIIVLMMILLSALNSFGAEAADVGEPATGETIARGTGEDVSEVTMRRFAEKAKSKYDSGSFFVEGFLKLKYENIKNEKQTSSLLRSYADLNFMNIGVQGLSAHLGGSMQNNLKHADEIYDLYYAYVRYKTFQNALDIMAGRFELVDNNFMTVDGGKVTFITPYYFGITLYGGVPFYRDYEDRKVVFRDTGDLIYGGRIFLSGIESLTAYLGYSRETGKGDNGFLVYAELVNAGISYNYEFTKKLSAAAFMLGEYDISKGTFARASGKFRIRYGRAELALFGDLFDVRERYTRGRELAIQLLSNGREKRGGGKVAIDITTWFALYGGAYGTEVELKNGDKDNGAIYKAGFDLYLMKYAGLVINGEYYMYDTQKYDAMGGILSFDWRISQDFVLYVAGELAEFNNNGKKTAAYSVFSELKLYLLQDFYVSVFYEKGANNRFIDDMRCGATVKYAF